MNIVDDYTRGKELLEKAREHSGYKDYQVDKEMIESIGKILISHDVLPNTNSSEYRLGWNVGHECGMEDGYESGYGDGYADAKKESRKK